MTEELPDDGKGSQADECFGTRRQGASPFKAPDVDAHGERLQLTVPDRFASGVLTDGDCIAGAGSSSGGKRSLARGATDGHILAYDLADGHETECEEEQDEGNRSPLHERLSRL